MTYKIIKWKKRYLFIDWYIEIYVFRLSYDVLAILFVKVNVKQIFKHVDLNGCSSTLKNHLPHPLFVKSKRHNYFSLAANVFRLNVLICQLIIRLYYYSADVLLLRRLDRKGSEFLKIKSNYNKKQPFTYTTWCKQQNLFLPWEP